MPKNLFYPLIGLNVFALLLNKKYRYFIFQSDEMEPRRRLLMVKNDYYGVYFSMCICLNASVYYSENRPYVFEAVISRSHFVTGPMSIYRKNINKTLFVIL